jgi:hypothetical protein
MNYFAVVIYSTRLEMDPWISVFSTREQANDFAKRAKAIIERFGYQEDLVVASDSGLVDSDLYLELLDSDLDAYEEDE